MSLAIGCEDDCDIGDEFAVLVFDMLLSAAAATETPVKSPMAATVRRVLGFMGILQRRAVAPAPSNPRVRKRFTPRGRLRIKFPSFILCRSAPRRHAAGATAKPIAAGAAVWQNAGPEALERGHRP